MIITKTFSSSDVYDMIDDIQRVEDNCLILKNRISTLCGLDLKLDIKEDWTREDIPTIEEMERIRSNCERIVQVIGSEYSIPVFGDRFDYSRANQLEEALRKTNEFLERLIEICDRPRAGFYAAAEPLFLLPGRS